MKALLFQLSVAAVLAVTSGCDGAEVPQRGRPRAKRLAAQGAALDAALERMKTSGIDAPLRAALEELVAREGDWFRLEDGAGLGRYAVESHIRWTERALAFDDADHPLHAIVAHARQLEAHGIELLVVPAPTRLQIYPDRLAGVPAQGSGFLGHAPETTAFLRVLVDAGVEVLDLLPVLAGARDDPRHHDPVLRDRLYLDGDYHWTPRAVALSSAAIASRLAQMPSFERGPARTDEDFVVRIERGQYVLAGKNDPEPEPVSWPQVLSAAGGPAHEKDRESPLLLLGDSFAMQFKERGCDLASQLYACTGHRVDAITFAAGSTKTWAALERRADGLAGKRWVVWVFTARALQLAKFETVELFSD